jgi:hypothetical protein
MEFIGGKEGEKRKVECLGLRGSANIGRRRTRMVGKRRREKKNLDLKSGEN